MSFLEYIKSDGRFWSHENRGIVKPHTGVETTPLVIVSNHIETYAEDTHDPVSWGQQTLVVVVGRQSPLNQHGEKHFKHQVSEETNFVQLLRKEQYK